MYNINMEYLDCYLRVSSTVQKKDGNSLLVQRKTGEKVSKMLGMKCRIHDEGSKSSLAKFRIHLEDIKSQIENGLIKNIWVVDEAEMRAVKRQVKVGRLKNDGIEILDGLTGGELIVTAGVHQIVNGQPVRAWVNERGL